MSTPPNIFEAVKLLIGSSGYETYRPVTLEFDSDFPQWKTPGDKDVVSISGRFILEENDSAIATFIEKQLSLNVSINDFSITVAISKGSTNHDVTVSAGDQTVTGTSANEVWRRLRSEGTLVFHNSTTDSFRLSWGGGHGQISDISQAVSSAMAQMRSDIAKKMKRVTNSTQSELQGLLGRLSEKWKISLDLPELSAEIPFTLVLGDSSVSVPLNNWGSGTKNRAMIILALLRAAQSRKMTSEIKKVIPIVVIEEPESFLHPSAQAEFGSLLIDLATELNVQVIVATHSVYLLNTSKPSANILVCRQKFRGRPRQTVLEDADDENWMKPFSVALGLSNESISPWRPMLTARGKKVVLVEGQTDQEYLEMLKSSDHGRHRLRPEIEIIQYSGFGNITNQAALRVMLELAENAVVTVDLDALEKVEKTFQSLQLKRNQDYMTVGIDKVGKKCMEGLLPDALRQNVLHDNPELFQGLMDRTADEKSIRNRIKSAYLSEFKRNAKPGNDFSGLYKISDALNKVLS